MGARDRIPQNTTRSSKLQAKDALFHLPAELSGTHLSSQIRENWSPVDLNLRLRETQGPPPKQIKTSSPHAASPSYLTLLGKGQYMDGLVVAHRLFGMPLLPMAHQKMVGH
jgi:hypothetical protein